MFCYQDCYYGFTDFKVLIFGFKKLTLLLILKKRFFISPIIGDIEVIFLEWLVIRITERLTYTIGVYIYV